MKKMMTQKKNSKINNKNKLKNTMVSDNSNIENSMNTKDIYIKITIIISGILTIMGAVLNMDNSLINNKLTLTFVIKYLFNKMRFIFSKIFSVLFSKKEVSLGSDNAGKTILLYQMQCDEQNEIRLY